MVRGGSPKGRELNRPAEFLTAQHLSGACPDRRHVHVER